VLNKAASELLDRYADMLEINGANPFRVRAFRTAARRVDSLTDDLTELAAADRLESVPGIGKGIAGFLKEFVTAGRVAEHDELRRAIPDGVFEMLRIPGVGTKTVATLFHELAITGVAELEAAARAGRLAEAPGIGAKREAKLLKELERFRERTARHPIGEVLPLAEQLLEAIRRAPAVRMAAYAGSLRRMRETIGDLDLLAASETPAPVMESFVQAPEVTEVLGHGPTKTSVLVRGGLQVDLLVVPPASFGAALQYFTGSKEHNVELRGRAQRLGLSLNEFGVLEDASGRRRPCATEAEVYAAVGLPWIAPELREGRGELAAAEAAALPALLTLEDIRGEMHGHSIWSDGSAPIDAMVRAARATGYAYVGITDHSGALQVANGLSPERLFAQKAEIAQARAAHPGFHILHGSEVEILPDGALDYDDALLASLDVVVASVHTNFTQSREAMTERLLRAIRHPHVDVIGHPTGRLLGRRDGYAFDPETVFRAAADTGTALELNASPDRLDLNDVHVRRAVELGAPIAINSDAHDPSHFASMRYGVGTARRAWLSRAHVLNTLDAAALRAWLGRPKPRRGSLPG